MCLCLKEIVGADTCRSLTASVHTLFSALGTRGFYSRAASLQASSPFGGYGEKQTREKRPRGDEKARRRGISPLARAFSRGSLRSPKYSLRSRRLEVVGTRKNERARARSFLHLLHRLAQLGELARRLACSGMLRSRPQAMVNQCWPFNAGTSSYKPLAFYEVSSPPTLLIPLYHLLLFNLNCIVFQD